MSLRVALLLVFTLLAAPSNAAEPQPSETIDQAVQAAGGRDKLLTLFRMKEKYNFGEKVDPKGTARESVCEPPASWWLGKTERQKEPAKYVVWAWTLGAVLDPKAKIESIAGLVDEGTETVGLKVSVVVDPPMELYFSKAEHRLVRIDWRGDIYRCSDWKEHDGAKYPAKCVMYKKSTGKPTFFHEILELERLKELPAGLAR